MFYIKSVYKEILLGQKRQWWQPCVSSSCKMFAEQTEPVGVGSQDCHEDKNDDKERPRRSHNSLWEVWSSKKSFESWMMWRGHANYSLKMSYGPTCVWGTFLASQELQGRPKTSGADQKFVNHLMQLIIYDDGDCNKDDVDWRQRWRWWY